LILAPLGEVLVGGSGAEFLYTNNAASAKRLPLSILCILEYNYYGIWYENNSEVHISTQLPLEKLKLTMALNCINLHQERSEDFGGRGSLKVFLYIPVQTIIRKLCIISLHHM